MSKPCKNLAVAVLCFFMHSFCFGLHVTHSANESKHGHMDEAHVHMLIAGSIFIKHATAEPEHFDLVYAHDADDHRHASGHKHKHHHHCHYQCCVQDIAASNSDLLFFSDGKKALYQTGAQFLPDAKVSTPYKPPILS